MEVFHPSQREALGLNKNLSIPVTIASHTHAYSQFSKVHVCERDKVYGEDRDREGIRQTE